MKKPKQIPPKDSGKSPTRKSKKEVEAAKKLANLASGLLKKKDEIKVIFSFFYFSYIFTYIVE